MRAGHSVHGLTSLQCEALLRLLQSVDDRYSVPQWSAENSVVQLHLDDRCLPQGKTVLPALTQSLTVSIPSVLESNVETRFGFLINGLKAKSAPIKLEATLRASVIKRLTSDFMGGLVDGVSITSISLEIGPEETVIKGVLSKEFRPYEMEEATHIVGVDPGMVNTIALSVVKVDQKLDPSFFERCSKWTKSEAKAYLESHAHDGEVVEQKLFDGTDFLARVNAHGEYIDRINGATPVYAVGN